ncbi:YezD family protein [Aneurinibacillus terranovensis]|uniref:YezD family protein n=1 Tax=Aneurinibacillus terranovensis TaxID=278991 RepID=UPI0004001C53|nr:YezD family protein [Aneurinibacillus terranovensis]
MCKHRDDPEVQMILEALEDIQYGSLVITIHDSKITQMEKTVKSRFPLEAKTPSSRISSFPSQKKK